LCAAEDTSRLEREVAAIFRHLREPLYRYLLRLLRDAAEAEDLTQEVFLRLFAALREGQKVGNVRGWVFRVGHNLAINQQKRQGPVESLDDPSCRLGCERVDERHNAEQCIQESERHGRLHNALALLSRQERLCLDLRVEGLRYREIADDLGVSISTVATLIGRALEKLIRANHE
jgi:RNA polymerase sigma-70 factor (ECF subfamily)